MHVAVFTDPRMIDHRVPAHHPERPERLQAILRHLERTGYLPPAAGPPRARGAPKPSSSGVTRSAYLHRVAGLEAAGGGMLDPDTWVSPGSDLAARLAAGAGIEAVSFVLGSAGPAGAVPGSPAGPPRAAGRRDGLLHLRQHRRGRGGRPGSHSTQRVLIVDFDVHHGNGTQEIFYASDRVGIPVDPSLPVLSRAPVHATRPAPGAGLGRTMNIPLPYGTARSDYHAAFRAGLEKLADRIRPELVLISAGFDAHAEDPVGDLGLEVEDFEILTARSSRLRRRTPPAGS